MRITNVKCSINNITVLQLGKPTAESVKKKNHQY